MTCAALWCPETPDRTVAWQRDGVIVDYSHECREHAIESATVPGACDSSGNTTFAAVIPGIRNLKIGA